MCVQCFLYLLCGFVGWCGQCDVQFWMCVEQIGEYVDDGCCFVCVWFVVDDCYVIGQCDDCCDVLLVDFVGSWFEVMGEIVV